MGECWTGFLLAYVVLSLTTGSGKHFFLRLSPLTICLSRFSTCLQGDYTLVFVRISEVSELEFSNECIVYHCDWLIEWFIETGSHIAQLYLEFNTYMRLVLNPGLLHLLSEFKDCRLVPPCPALSPIPPLRHAFPLFSSQLKRNLPLWWQNWKLSSLYPFSFPSSCALLFSCVGIIYLFHFHT